MASIVELMTPYSELELLDALWSGGKANALRIDDMGAWGDFMDWLADMVEEGAVQPDLTVVNDLLWYDFDYVLSELGIEAGDGDEDY